MESLSDGEGNFHYDALKEAGATEEKARKAVEVLANYENRFAKIEADLRLHSWMLAYLIATSTAIMWKVFTG